MDRFWAEMMLAGESAYRFKLDKSLDPEEAFVDLLRQQVADGCSADNYRLAAHDLWKARWYESGFPRVRVGHKLSSSLMATRTPQGVMEDIRPPWGAFAIDLPTGLLPAPQWTASSSSDVGDDLFDDSFVSYVLVLVVDGAVVISGYHDKLRGGEVDVMPLVVADGQSLDDFASFEAADADGNAPACEASLSLPRKACLSEYRSFLSRSRIALARLALGVCVETSHRRDGSSSSVPYTKRSPPKGGAGIVMSLSRDVRVDCRGEVREYIRGGGSPPTVRRLVRGHWKMQPHGPRNSQRRWQHIEPYWSGDPLLPIAVRSHLLIDDA